MASQQFDAEDIGLLVLGIFSAATMVGIASVGAFGVTLSDTFTVAGFTTSLAWVITLGSFLGTVFTNDNMDLLSSEGYANLKSAADSSSSGMTDYYAYIVIGAAVALVAWVFIPEVAEFFQSQDLWGVLYIAGMATAQVAIGWMY
ncbi:hypothetical protein QTL95_09310 [Rhizobium sp. S152]|uniref:Uncharacterized protein n=2 Tax=cellular organisms TaxID=131567 RepID=A0ABD5WFT3_9EURY|nr:MULTISPECIES: hypothetical protein [Bacteria]MDM9626094.1 hypothetical protein [Rhizobium sp. S152]